MPHSPSLYNEGSMNNKIVVSSRDRPCILLVICPKYLERKPLQLGKLLILLQ